MKKLFALSIITSSLLTAAEADQPLPRTPVTFCGVVNKQYVQGTTTVSSIKALKESPEFCTLKKFHYCCTRW